MKRCNLLTLFAAAVMELKQEGEFVADLRDPLVYEAVVKANEAFEECAMQYQILDEVNRGGGEGSNRPSALRVRSVERLLVFVDFENVPFEDDLGERADVRSLFEKGFYLFFEGEQNRRHFRFFEKSASMARRSKISFLCDSWEGSGIPGTDDRIDGLKERMNRRLGLDLSTSMAILSKWAAYRGLYFTTSRRIESPLLDLNEKTVVVVDDYLEGQRPHTPPHDVITASNPNGDQVSWEIRVKNEKINLTPFDGEGLIAPEWAKRISYRYSRNRAAAIPEEILNLLCEIDGLKIRREKWTELLRSAIRNARDADTTVYESLILFAANYLHRSIKEVIAEFEKSGSAAEEALYRQYNNTYSKAARRELTDLLVRTEAPATDRETWETLLNNAMRETENVGGSVYDNLLFAAADHLKCTFDEMEKALEAAGIREEVLRKSEKLLHMISSFQIRMPFAKGVLHRVDFLKFAEEFLGGAEHGTESREELMIRDMFGRQRALKDVKILMTRSMFKCAGWLKDHCDDLEKTTGVSVDPMKYYFEKFHEYHHGLYVANTDAVVRNRGVVKVNYQFLGPMALTEEDLGKLVDAHIAYADKLKRNNLLNEHSNADEIPEESDGQESAPQELTGTDSLTPDDDGLDILRNPSTWYTVLREDRRFVNDSTILAKCKENREYLLRDMASARLLMKGECRFLSSDLLGLLYYMIQLLHVDIEHTDLKSKMYDLSKETLRSDRFYLPQATAYMELEPEKFYVFLRNPHLSRNEECVLNPYLPEPGGCYRRYMGHLKGVVMVGRLSLVPSALGGADHDGDLVKIINNPILSAAVKRSVGSYTRNKETSDFSRRLPEIMIPSVHADPKKISDFGEQFRTISDTFANSVGYISNLAIQWGRDEYFAGRRNAENKCVECSILTGLEIDACKNGCHPSLEAVKREDAGKDFYLNGVDAMRGVATYSLRNVTRTGSGSSDSLQALFQTYRGKKETIVFRNPEEKGRTASNLDRLLRAYAEQELKELETEKESERTVPVPLFPEMRKKNDPHAVDSKWRGSLDYERLVIVGAMIMAYQKVFRVYRIEKENTELREKSRYRAYIRQILQLQSTDNQADNEVLEEARNYIAGVLEDQNAVEEALKRLSSMKWMYTPAAKRSERLYGILHGSEAKAEPEFYENNRAWIAMLSDFSENGYNLLYYLLKDRLTYVLAEDRIGESDLEEDVLLQEAAEESAAGGFIEKIAGSAEYIGFCREYMNIYRRARDGKQKRSSWEAELVRVCRNDLLKYFAANAAEEKRSGDEILAEAVPYAYAFRTSSREWNLDRNGRFFWNVFTPRSILIAAETPGYELSGETEAKAGAENGYVERMTEYDGGADDAE